jgi:hypothetical protein
VNEPEPSEESLFFAACRLTDPAERAAFLDARCGDDAALRHRLEALLAERAEADAFFGQPPPGVAELGGVPPAATPESRVSGEKAGDRIGPYKLLQQIGEGGCGVVFMAEQEQPIRRKVALKVIKLGMDTDASGHYSGKTRQAPGMRNNVPGGCQRR